MPLFLVPARDSRHRLACFALYRALLRQVPRVPLPDDVATGISPVNPIKWLVRSGFRRNQKETSPRLVISALRNGYRYLDLLTRAQNPSAGPEHAQVLAFLRANQARVLPLLNRTRRTKTSAPIPGTIPLLTRVRGSDGRSDPVYVSTVRPRPLSEIKGGIRRVPTMDESVGFPFLRLTKPQPSVLSRVLTQKSFSVRGAMVRRSELLQTIIPDVQDEDRWEYSVRQMLRDHGRASSEFVDNSATYARVLHNEVNAIHDRMNEIQKDKMARGRALWKIICEEKALAEAEAKERKEAARRAKKEATEADEAPADTRKLSIYGRPVRTLTRKRTKSPKEVDPAHDEEMRAIHKILAASQEPIKPKTNAACAAGTKKQDRRNRADARMP
ncbi:hypothetical protein B0T26DRAFT_723651 [Lasiosphaeria miniovina]|uniref:Complex 1 LYR protein domain-containing protein n=1 Tax=Lasiosphaeria miniovina TaxID=1954250 RepID=A0AA40DS55_9PEZI|nr:uncharacterized protein B0T26DRAFT_723651 [Lasiosphaeria miniovina]KAK0709968.1 hypothetical protein B0T26DRAFT_723651 [Lasiosphaeria miniovina]